MQILKKKKNKLGRSGSKINFRIQKNRQRKNLNIMFVELHAYIFRCVSYEIYFKILNFTRDALPFRIFE